VLDAAVQPPSSAVGSAPLPTHVPADETNT
jgi:hypothetical protein